ncbi:MAG TPA: sugar ABC transporter ATP-binding protein [Candidatus Nanopelagicaceae bacterium]
MEKDTSAWLQVKGLSKHFAGVAALSAVDLDIYRGEVHGLVGANGSGKSTFIRSLAGVVAPDQGVISLENKEIDVNSPRDAEKAGFAFIHQELNLVPYFNSIENILLGVPKPTRAGFIDWKRSTKIVEEVAERVGINFSLTKRVDELSVAERWLVMISKALVYKADMIAMDEPTASLSDVESKRLFEVVRSLAASGVAVLYVSHRLDEVLDLSDRITVFRDGHVIKRAMRGSLDKPGLINAIVGRDILSGPEEKSESIDLGSEPIFEAKGVTRANAVRNVSFQLFKGEVLGFGGVIGAGRTELARIAFGADKMDSGSFTLHGRPVVSKSSSAAIAHGIGLIPEERRAEGLMLNKSIDYNMNIVAMRSLRKVSWLPFSNKKKAKARSLRLVKELGIKISDVSQPVSELSGGNQQKVLIGRWLVPEMKVLFFDEPSRGVDVGARQEIHQVIRNLSDSGVGTIVISSDAEELAALCDRVIVMREGRVNGMISGSNVTEQNIIELGYHHSVSN